MLLLVLINDLFTGWRTLPCCTYGTMFANASQHSLSKLPIKYAQCVPTAHCVAGPRAAGLSNWWHERTRSQHVGSLPAHEQQTLTQMLSGIQDVCCHSLL